MVENISKILFLDIETVPAYPSFEKAPEVYQNLWKKKAVYLRKDEESDAEIYGRAGIYAEFGKIVCISSGVIHYEHGEQHLRIKSFYGDDEKKLLLEFAEMLDKHFFHEDSRLCAHNGKEFDFPYLCRRMLVNNIEIPKALNLRGKKPWEIQHIDTMELWKFGDYKNFTSLETLAYLFGIPSPKEDIDGSMVKVVYWQEKNIERIVKYCQNDVKTLTNLYLKMTSQNIISEENVSYV